MVYKNYTYFGLFRQCINVVFHKKWPNMRPGIFFLLFFTENL